MPVACTLENARKKIDELEKKREEIRASLGQKQEKLEKTKGVKTAARVGAQVEKLKQKLAKAEKALAKAKKEYAKLEERRKKILLDLGQRRFNERDIALMTPEEFDAHVRGLVERKVNEIDIVSQLYYRATQFPDEHPFLASMFGEKVVKEGKDGKKTEKWKFRAMSVFTGTRKGAHTHLTGITNAVRAFYRAAASNSIDYEKTPNRPGEEPTRVVRDTMVADSEPVEVRSDVEAMLEADRIVRERENAPDLLPHMDETRLEGSGPAEPNTVPLGKVGADGKRVVTNGGEPRGQQPVPVVEGVSWGYLNRFLNRTKEAWNAITRLYEKAVGKADLPRFYHAIRAAIDARDFAMSRNDSHRRKLADALTRFRIDVRDPAVLLRIRKALMHLDNELEKIRKKTYKEARDAGASHDQARDLALTAVERAYDAKLAGVREEYKLEVNEVSIIRWLHDKYFPELFKELGLDPREFRYGYFPRIMRSLASYWEVGRGVEAEGDIEWLSFDPTIAPHHAAHLRWAENMNEISELDPSLHRQMQDVMASEALELATLGNPFDIILSYTRQAMIRRYAGEYIRDFIAQFGVEESGTAIRLMLGDARVHVDIVKRARRDIIALMGLPTKAMAEKNVRTRAALIARAKAMKRLVDKLESLHAPRAIVEPVRWYLRRLGIAASRTEVRNLLDSFAYNHRAVTFGLNLMAPVRDTASTTFLANLAFDMTKTARAFKEVYLRGLVQPKEVFNEYLRQYAKGWVRWLTEGLAMEELVASGETIGGISWADIQQDPKLLLKALKNTDWREAATVLYRMSDMATRVMVNRAAELQSTEAFRKFRKHGDVGKLVEEAHLATLPSEVAKELIEIAKRGREEEFVDAYVRAKQRETAMSYDRYMSAPFMDYALGRVLFQYGTWSHNFLGTMYHQLSSPWKLANDGVITHGQAARIQMKLYSKYATTAVAMYSMGAMLGIDNTDWIPWIHNAVPGGGPMMSNFLAMHEALTGDPDSVGAGWSDDPLGRAMLVMSKAVPGFPVWPGTPNSIRRFVGGAIGDFLPFDEEVTRRIFGLPPDEYQDTWNAFLSLAGFHPLTPDSEPPFRGGGLLYALASYPAASVQDLLHRHVGLPPSPSTIRGE